MGDNCLPFFLIFNYEIMKKKFTTFLVFFIAIICYAQEINFQDINSNNILRMLQSNQEIKISNSEVTNLQSGNENKIYIFDNSAKKLEISQQGNFNTTQYVNPGSKPTNIEVKSFGNNNYIDITGNNSNSDGMKIQVRGNDKMIFVRNY